jgi:HAD superfamily hydrolase (TIGR01458 family)
MPEANDMFDTHALPLGAALLDVQGTLLAGDGSPVPGAAEALARLRDFGLKVRFVTNIDSVPVATIAERLHKAGFAAGEAEIFSPISAAKRFLARQDRARCHLLLPPSIESEFAEFRANGDGVDWVLVGDCRDGFTYQRLNEAFRLVKKGAEILALQKGRWFVSPDGPSLDTGAFVAALEFGANRQAHVVGKPSMELMRLALQDVGGDPFAAVMVGDDVCSDIPGAHAAGMRSVLVRTGKFTLSALERSETKPDLLIDSVADLPEALRELVR